jgi:hypothetical protein
MFLFPNYHLVVLTFEKDGAPFHRPVRLPQEHQEG